LDFARVVGAIFPSLMLILRVRATFRTFSARTVSAKFSPPGRRIPFLTENAILAEMAVVAVVGNRRR